MPRRRLGILRLIATLALAAASATTAGCAGTSAAGDTSLSAVTLKVGQTGWAQHLAALQVAHLDNTPYKLTFPVFTGGDKQLQALNAGAIDLAETSEIPPVFAAAAGDPKFRVVAVQQANTLQQEVVVEGKSPITTIAGLKGRKVGYVKNTTAQYFLVKLLEQAGLTWADIRPAPLSPTDGVAALHSGAVDAFASYGNSIIAAHQNGARTIGSGKDILSGNFPWEASTAALADPAKRAAVVDLLSRIDRAYKFIQNGHEQEYAQKTATATHQPLSQALSTLQAGEKQRPSAIVPTSPAAIASEQSVADVFTELGAIPAKLAVSSFWTDTLDADLKRATS
jgi:sulfonate transport system substrate-binding protein